MACAESNAQKTVAKILKSLSFALKKFRIFSAQLQQDVLPGKNRFTLASYFPFMLQTIFKYGAVLAMLTGLLKFAEYRFFARELSVEFYIGFLALLFTSVGIWAGRKLTRTKIITINADFKVDTGALERLGISKREYEALQSIAEGHSTQEIADKLFVSISTIKTHTSNLYSKLNAKRRTQAIQRAKELRLLP